MKLAHIINLPRSFSDVYYTGETERPSLTLNRKKTYSRQMMAIINWLEQSYDPNDYRLLEQDVLFTDIKLAEQFSDFVNNLDVTDSVTGSSPFLCEADYRKQKETISYVADISKLNGADEYNSTNLLSDGMGRNLFAEKCWKLLYDAKITQYWMIAGRLFFKHVEDGILAESIIDNALVEWENDKNKPNLYYNTSSITASSISFASNTVTSGSSAGLQIFNQNGSLVDTSGNTVVNLSKIINKKVNRVLKKAKKNGRSRNAVRTTGNG